MSKYLSGGKVNVALLQEHLNSCLLRLIEKCDGTKAIVWDDGLNSLFGLIVQTHTLTNERNVTNMYRIQPGALPNCNHKNIIFICRPRINLMDMIAENIHHKEQAKSRKEATEYHLLFVPRESAFCVSRLKIKGVFGNFRTIAEVPCYIYPFDNDLMSMDLDTLYQDFYVDKDPGCLYQVAQAIILIEKLYGRPIRVFGKGEASKHVWDVVSKLRHSSQPANRSLIDSMVLIDRASDLVSPMATQLTYAGLIDEIYGIRTTTVVFPGSKFAHVDNTADVISVHKVILNSSDSLFTEIRDKNFNAVGGLLNRKAIELNDQVKERPDQDHSVEYIKDYVARLPHLVSSKKSLGIHTTIAEMIQEVTDSTEFLDSLQLEQELMLGVDTDRIQSHIDTLIAHRHSLVKVLRLICLQSATNSGLKPKVLEHYIREIVQTYGFNHILTLGKLEKAGLLKLQSNSRAYTVLRKTLRLTVEDGSETQPRDINFTHSVYCPISVRLVQAAVGKGPGNGPPGWSALGDVLDLLPGPVFSTVSSSHLTSRRDSLGSENSQRDKTKVVLVFFIGGCTLAEIAALRFLSQKEDSGVEYVIATSKIITGNNFISSLMENLDG